MYGSTATHNFSLGFYVQPEYDSTRANVLGYNSNGKLAIGYIGWDTDFGPISLNVNGASTLGSYSTWDFSRLTATGEFSTSFKKVKFKERLIVGKIWANDNGVPGQEGYNIEGNSSNDLLRKNYLVDQFYGINDLFSQYHMPGEGNIRAFVGTGVPGAEALFSSSTELSLFNSIPKTNIGLELSSFFDGGVFFDSTSKKRILGDVGLGIRFNTTLLEKNFYLRIDYPLFIYEDTASAFQFNKWIFSFQRSI